MAIDASCTVPPATRRFLYQLVTMRIPHVSDPVRNYIHALNVFENKPKYECPIHEKLMTCKSR